MAERGRSERKAAKPATGFSAEEKVAARERVRELKAEANRANGEQEVLTKIAEMQPPDRVLAERLHAIIKAAVPTLAAKTWYGMPAYTREEEIVCFFQPAEKFKTRYMTLGFSDEAKLDEGHMWPTSYALTELTAAEEARITALVKRAVG